MANAIYSKNRRAYVTPVSTFGTAVAPTNSNAFRHIDLKFTPTQSESQRPDLNPTLDVALGVLGRKSCAFEGSCSLAAASGAGVAPDVGPILKALFGKETIVAATSVTYETDDPMLYVDLWQYVTPSTGDQEALASCTVQQGSIEFGGDYCIFKFSGEGKAYITSAAFSSLDTEGKAGLASFPTEPATPVVNGAAISGYRGTITLDGNAYTIARSGTLAMNFQKPLQHDGWGTDYPAAAAAEQRFGMLDISLYDDDSTNLNTLKGKAVTGTTVDAIFVLGAVAGGIYTVTLKNILLSKPQYDNSGTKRVVSFNQCRTHPTSGTSKDQVKIAIT